MNYEFFIAYRLIKEKTATRVASTPIVRIAIIAIAMSLIMMLVSVAVGVGLQQKIQQKIALFSGHIEITSFNGNESEVSLQPIDGEADFLEEIETLPFVTHFHKIAKKQGVIRTTTDFEPILFKGVFEDYNWATFNEYLVKGRLPNLKSNYNEILISESLANRLQLNIEDKAVTYFIKDTGKYNIRSFKVVGIYNSGYEEFDKGLILGSINHIIKLNKWSKNQVGSFEIFVDDFNHVEDHTIKVYEQIPSELDAIAIKEKYAEIFQWLKLFDFNVYGIIGIMIIVASINIITALLVLILERTQLIGMLKSLGSTNKSIRKLFIYQASYIVGKGLLWGNVIGLGIILCQYYFRFIKMDPKTYYVQYAPMYISWDYIIGLNVLTFILCVLALWIPTLVINKISPVKALKLQ